MQIKLKMVGREVCDVLSKIVYNMCSSVCDAMGGAAERAAGGAGAVARPGGRVPQQDDAGGAPLAPHAPAAPTPLAGPRRATPGQAEPRWATRSHAGP